ncbi:MAG TPA: aldehyde ferredoxin oxidoreductase family protein [Methylomirabilota bacterium]|jgi:aldehyde:ferredoxin oxidoreductase|nr:aldehyde ferredoxin oxidoreductase family protein [Methylomirabilota bacterium]
MYGFYGRMLHVELSTGTLLWRDLPENQLQSVLGGIGLGTRLLYEYAPSQVDPFAPENPLIFTSAPLVGTGLTTTAKFAVTTTSPLTGFIADSLSSSFFALELKRTGLDAIVITGAAAAPVFLWITEDTVEIREATHLWGKSASDTETAIREALGDREARVAAIGVAGEQRVRYATISNEGRHAGRGGVGAVMGAKNLKAIALRGRMRANVADPAGVEVIADVLRQKSVSTLTAKYREIGTVANLAVFNRLGVLPTRNFQQSTFAHVDALSGETLLTDSFSRAHGCASCTIRCERLFRSLNGEEQRLEYETLFALGPLCGIESADAVLHAAQLCDLYGLDTISTGGTIAWAMECAEKGLFPEAAALGLRFGNAAALFAAIHALAKRNGVGALLAEGSRRAAAHVGAEAEQLAMHVKGMELPGYEPRGLKSMALGLAVSPRGACHNRSGAYEADFSGQADRLHADPRRGELVVAAEDFAAVLDSLIICKFLRRCFTDFYPEAAELLAKVTGWSYAADEVRRIGERINILKKLFNLRQGWQPQDDWLPPRLLTEPLSTGMAQGTLLTSAELREMIQAYYKARGWNEQGFVPEEKLKELHLW